MRLFQDLTKVQLGRPTVSTIGTFDGLHRGHHSLIEQLKEAAQRRRVQSAVIAFHPRPKAVFSPHLYGNDYLTTVEERVNLFEQLGVNVLIVTPFTLQLSQIGAYDFMKLLVDRLKLVEFWTGHNFVLGKNREGTIEKLRAIGHDLNYSLHEFTPFLIDDEVVSSTRIRHLLISGDMRQATHLLGRYPSLRSRIIRGAQRGRIIGFPTANFAVPDERLIPLNGVYAVFVRLPKSDRRYSGVANIGVRPSFDGEDKCIVEAHILDFKQDLYGQSLTLEFVERLRPEKKFNGIHELKAQITKDAAQARTILAAEIHDTSL